MPDSFNLLVWADAGLRLSSQYSVLLSESGKLKPPKWADSVSIAEEEGVLAPHAALLITGSEPTAYARETFFSLFRRGVPTGALVSGSPSFSEPLFSKLKEWERCWVFSDGGHMVSMVHNDIQRWLLEVARGPASYPSGEELILSWKGVAGESVDPASLMEASSILRDRGFVCLSGPMGAGKTTLARLLLMDGADEGLIPLELIDRTVDGPGIERKLRGPEDCILLFDLDLIRRLIDIHPIHLFHAVLTIILRATDSRRRVVLTSSHPRISGLFSLFGGAHVELPAPGENRLWRVEQGEKALHTFRELDIFKKAELVLLSLFEPIVPETVFKSSLREVWSRLHFLLRETFPSSVFLDEMYSETRASAGTPPFRRLSIGGEVHLCSGDTLILNAVDQGMAELSGGGSPLIRVVMETLMNGRYTEQRLAGYNIAHMYRHLSSSEKSRLLFAASRETGDGNLVDFFAMLLAEREVFDRSAEGLCRHVLESGSMAARKALAEGLGKPWIRRDHYFRDLVEKAASDSDDTVRASLLRSMDMWGVAGDPGGFMARLLNDTSPEVKRSALMHLGRKFPALAGNEMDLVNGSLSRGKDDELMALVFGLMNRQLGEFDRESGDLLWLLMQRLPEGGRSLVAFQIGARIRFFDSGIRRALFQGVSGNDTRVVAQCMLMNYEYLTPDEKASLWSMIAAQMPRSFLMAGMVLPFIRILEEDEQKRLLHITLASEGYGAREALSQLLAGGREDVAFIALEVVSEMVTHGSVEERSRLPWFLLWNRESLGSRGEHFLRVLSSDADPVVRKALAKGVQRLGTRTETDFVLLRLLAHDGERSVRAAAGEALGEFAESEDDLKHASALAEDTDPFVRLGIQRGVASSPDLDLLLKISFLLLFLEDSDPSVRLGTISHLERIPSIPNVPGLIERLTRLLADGSEEVRNGVARLVTTHPSIVSSRELKKNLPDLYLGRFFTGETLADELNTARRIQMGLLPTAPPRYENYDIAVFYSPAREVGGDYYDFFSLPDGNLGMAVADVAGKGIPAALTMAGMKGTLGASVRSIFDIGQIMARLNSELSAGGEISSLVGLFYGVLNTGNGLLTYVNAGHNPPLLISRAGEVVRLEEGGILMGVAKDASYGYGTVQTHPGDLLVMYTDGITETMNTEEEEFGEDGLLEAVLGHRDLNAEQIVSRVLKAVDFHGGGAPQADDRTVVLVKHR
jgi:hypothetical protein